MSANGLDACIRLCVCTFSSDAKLLESTLLTYAQIFSRVRKLDDEKLFMEIFHFISVLLDNKMAEESGKMGTKGLLTHHRCPSSTLYFFFHLKGLGRVLKSFSWLA